MPPLTVVLIEAHAGFSEGVIHLVQARLGDRVVIEPRAWHAALPAELAIIGPDVVLFGIDSRGREQLPALHAIRAALPGAVIFVLTVLSAAGYADALRADRVAAIFQKDALDHTLVPALRQLAP